MQIRLDRASQNRYLRSCFIFPPTILLTRAFHWFHSLFCKFGSDLQTSTLIYGDFGVFIILWSL